MAATALVKDVLWRISVQLQDHAPQFQAWTERELVHWLNDGQEAIATYLPLSCSRVDAIKLKTGTKQSIAAIADTDIKPGDGSTPAQTFGKQMLNPRRNMGANGTTPGAAIRMVERDTLDSTDPLWHTRSGNAVRSVVFDPQTPRDFYVSPGVPVGVTVWIELAFTAKPKTITNNGTPGSELYLTDGSSTLAISIDDEFVPMLVDYVLARAHLKETKRAEPAKAQEASQRFLGQLNAKVTAVTGNNPNLTVLPGVQAQ